MKTSLSFESRILIFVCSLVLIRMIDPIVRLVTVGLPIEYIVVNSAISFISVVVIVATLMRHESRVTSFGLSMLFVVMFSYNWISRNGLISTSDVNYIAGLIMVATINRGRYLKSGLVIALSIISLTVVTWIVAPDTFDFLDKFPTQQVYKYQMVVLLVTIFIVYWANQYEHDHGEKLKQSELISIKIEELERENKKLEIQQRELEQVNEKLENMVQERVESLTNSNRQISEFLDVNSNEITPTIDQLLKDIKTAEGRMDATTHLAWLSKSGAKLDMAFQEVRDSYRQTEETS